MISVVIYGRNDSHGYNLHKRAALSLNCLAEVLNGDDDEILFVDYNTPNDLPTFPQAIQDTLTKKARQRLRIFRVRPHIHKRVSGRTPLPAIEPISRNVAIRRSNPENRWVLSTNTDLIFVTSAGGSLTDCVRRLPRGFYAAPRIGIPETLWEGLDRQKPELAIKTIRDWGSALHLSQIVRVSKVVLYDNPGDFQLIERRDLFDIHGFDEEMILGWHVDSNMFKRLHLIHGDVGDLGGEVRGYHCDHTRQPTALHAPRCTWNDHRRFVDDVLRPDVPEQATGWGCADDAIEELHLKEDASAIYVRALTEAIGAPLPAPTFVEYTASTYDSSDYDPRHVLPFLADMFACSERDMTIAWSGGREQTLWLFAQVWQKLGFVGRILVDEESARAGVFATAPSVVRVELATLLEESDAFIVDFGTPENAAADGKLDAALDEALRRIWLAMVESERSRLRNDKAPRQFVAINAINNRYASFVCKDIAAAATPLGTQMRHGFVQPQASDQDIAELRARLDRANAREAAIRASLSWRVMAPLRALSHLLRRGHPR